MKRLLTAVLATATLALAACGSGGSAADDGPVDLSTVTLKVGDQAGIQQALVEASGALRGVPYKVEWAQFPAAAQRDGSRADSSQRKRNFATVNIGALRFAFSYKFLSRIWNR